MSVPIRLPCDELAGRAGEQPDARAGVGRDDVAGPGRRAADRDAGHPADGPRRTVPLPSAIVPVLSVPIRLPRITAPIVALPWIDTPACALAEITLPAPGAVPPMVTPGEMSTEIPAPALPRGWVPVWSTPM